MKLLFTNFHERYGGGHDTYIFTLCKDLVNTQNIVVAAPPESLLLEKIATVVGVKTFPFNFQFRINKVFSLVKKIVKLSKFLAAERFDIVHVNGSKDHTLVLLASIFLDKRPKIIFTKHNSLPLKFGARIRLRYFTDHIIVVSEYIKLMFSCYKTPVKVIYNGVDTTFFQPYASAIVSALKQKFGIPAANLVFGSVAGTALYKGWSVFLEAIALLPPKLLQKITVIIAGSVPSEEIKKYRLENQVIFPGLLFDVREVIAVSDVGFVLSYVMEALSFACREMMSMGKPVIVSDCGGLPENITNGVDGYIVKAKNVASVKNCVMEIMERPQQLLTMSENARKKAVKFFSKEKFIADTLAVYKMFENRNV